MPFECKVINPLSQKITLNFISIHSYARFQKAQRISQGEK